jgi:tRNA uridine 5-carbamoylmethylation protein Kti12
MLRGLPASGKSTWAKELVEKEPGRWKRINKDELRTMLDNSKWSKQNENFVLVLRDYTITAALANHFNVIVDDTNLAPKHEETLKELAKNMGAEFEIKDFTDVDVAICIKRDMNRPNQVGKKVIMQMYNQFLRPPLSVIKEDPDLLTVLLVDIDGTLALFGKENPYDRDFSKDKVNPAVLSIIKKYEDDTPTIFVSGRKDTYYETTLEWIAKETGISKTNIMLFMRKADDNRHDFIIKKEIYDNEIRNRFNILFVLDDRLQTCRMWYQEGLPVFRFGDPDAEF